MKKGLLSIILIPFLFIYALPAGAADPNDRKWQDESVYFLMVDRYSNGNTDNDYHVDSLDPDAFHGGDFEGVIGKLDYIKDMGFTAIWLSPIFDNADKGYHGYWVNDFRSTEEHFGTLDEFKTLVDQAHNKGIKIILDFPVTHISDTHPWVTDESKKDWILSEKETEADGPEPFDSSWLNGLPKVNLDHKEAGDYLIETAKWWVTETDIDGLVIDEVNKTPNSFSSELSKEVKGLKDSFYLLGEIQTTDAETIAQSQGNGMDGFIDYPLAKVLRPSFSEVDQPLTQLIDAKEKNMKLYSDPYLMGTLMDDHKTFRYTRDSITKNQHPGPRWKLALTYLYTTPGIPIVYYGSEIALDGGFGTDNHRQMDFRTDKELVDYITSLGELRNNFPSLTRGQMEILGEKENLIVYKRTYENQTAVIAINNSSESQNIAIDADKLAKDKEIRGLLSDDLVKEENGQYQLFLDREEAEIYLLAEKSGLNIPYVIVSILIYGAFIGFIFYLWKRSKKQRANE